MVSDAADISQRVETFDTSLSSKPSFSGNKEDGTLVLLERMLIFQSLNGYALSWTIYEKSNVKYHKKYTFRSYRDCAFAVCSFTSIPRSSHEDTLSGVLLTYEHPPEKGVGGPVVTSMVFDDNLNLVRTREIYKFSEGWRVSDIEAILLRNSVSGKFAVRTRLAYRLSDGKSKEKREKECIVTRSFPELGSVGWWSRWRGKWCPFPEGYRAITPPGIFENALCALWVSYNGK